MDSRSPDLFNYIDLHSFLEDYYEFRKKTQPGWSYTVWARGLELKSPSTLIMLVHGQRNPGKELIDRMVKHFRFTRRESEYFRSLAALKKADGDVPKSLSLMKSIERHHPDKDFQLVDHLKFKTVSNWHFYAIRELVNLWDFSESPQWIAGRLGNAVTQTQARFALESLIKVGLLERNTKGDVQQSTRHIETSQDIADAGIKQFHTGVLSRAQESLIDTAPEAREISGCTFAIKDAQVRAAKKLIREFQLKMCELLECSKSDNVYQLEVAFFPLTKSMETKV